MSFLWICEKNTNQMSSDIVSHLLLCSLYRLHKAWLSQLIMGNNMFMLSSPFVLGLQTKTTLKWHCIPPMRHVSVKTKTGSEIQYVFERLSLSISSCVHWVIDRSAETVQRTAALIWKHTAEVCRNGIEQEFDQIKLKVEVVVRQAGEFISV